ncbi:MAG: hypothetical protein ACRD3V_33225 [Vicinamibacteria bacterium]
MTRVNFAPGQNRDLSKPLVEIDPNAPRVVRWGERALSVYVVALFVFGVGSILLLGILTLVAFLLHG